MTKLTISERVNNMQASATLAMAQAARELADAGVDVKILSAGEPDFATPEEISAIAKKSLDQGKTHYVPVRGTKNMLQAMQEKFLRDQKVQYELDELMCTVGAKTAIYMALDAVVNKDDEVIICAPYWVSYLEQVRLCGAKPVIINCQAQNNFMPTKEEVAKALTPKTKAIILNSPNNPSGGVITFQQLQGLAQVLAGTDVWVISDEIYESLLFDKHEHISLASINQDMKERTIVISGLAKGYAMTGWRVGVVAGNRKIIGAMAKLQGQQTTCLPEFIQDAAAFALRENATVKSSMKKMQDAYLLRRDTCLEKFKEIPEVKVFKPQGAFYVWADFSAILKRKNIANDNDLALKLLKEAHVATVPGGPFGSNGFLRLSIASSLEEISEAVSRIKAWINQ